MSLLQQIGFFIFNLAIGKANDISHAGPTNFGGYALGMWIFSILGFLALLFTLLLRQRETGPNAHGLETITTHGRAGRPPWAGSIPECLYPLLGGARLSGAAYKVGRRPL